MSKVRQFEIADYNQDEYLEKICLALASLDAKEDVRKFIKDLFTQSELIMATRRVIIAECLLQNRTYEEIREIMGNVGNSTIINVDKWLQNGYGGYARALQDKNRKSRVIKKDNRKDDFQFTISDLKNRYPGHFILFGDLFR